jgi:hypothetical protein
VPKDNHGHLEWCVREVKDNVTYMGCENYKDYLLGFERWDGKGGRAGMVQWLLRKIEADGVPMINKFFGTFAEQGHWMQRRDHTSSDNHLRNLYLSEAFPAFTPSGFKAMPIPPEFQKWMLEFYARNEPSRRTEFWDAESTQMSFTEVPTTFIDLDRERYAKEQMANKYLKPIVEEWSGVAPLELTSFYGMREYPDGSFLKNHVDRIDTHVLSVTMVVAKADMAAAEKRPWPLEVVQWSGDHVRYDHPAGTMVLYESSKLPHGRPFRNRGGLHVGAFLHFKPTQMHGGDAVKWENICNVARKNQEDHTLWGRYKSTKSVEPKEPVFSPVDYSSKAKWKHHNPNDEGEGDDDDGHPGRMSVKFENKSPRTLELYWESPQGEAVSQGVLAPGTSTTIQTYVDHKFFWGDKGSKKPLPQARMTMEQGRAKYQYSL